MIGKTINNYILEKKLGEGGMGDVYAARHNRVDRVVAVKVLHQNLFTNEKIRNRFKNEANALIKLGHPNIVKIYDYVEQDDFACLIMEFIEGFTLDDYITKVTGPLPAEKAIYIICSVLEAVQCAHDKNIFHRDIKPGNIMVSKDGKVVRIMDFGIAKFTDTANLKTTHANAQLGTPFYMSPEQVKGMPYTALSDIYSLGVTLFEMVTGKCPYLEITNLFELQSKIVNEPLPPTFKYYPDVIPKIQNAIKIATNKSPAKRFKSCNDFKTYLLEEEKQLPDSIQKQNQQIPRAVLLKSQTIKPQQPIEKRKKNKNWVYLLGLLSILIIGIITYSFLNQPDNLPLALPISETKLIIPVDSIFYNTNSIDTSAHKPVDTLIGEELLITSQKDSVYTLETVESPPSTPTLQMAVNDLNGQKICTDLVFSKNAIILSYSISKYNLQQCNTVITFKEKNDDVKYKVVMIYKNRNNKYTYESNICYPEKPIIVEDKKTPSAILAHNVKSDLLNYLNEKKSFGGIKYNDISEISITNIGDAVYYEDSGNTSYFVELIINNIIRKCQVTYPKLGDIYVKPLR